MKSSIYAQHGVRELWVVEAASRITWVHRRPDPDGSWGIVEKMTPDVPLSAESLPQIRVVMAELD